MARYRIADGKDRNQAEVTACEQNSTKKSVSSSIESASTTSSPGEGASGHTCYNDLVRSHCCFGNVSTGGVHQALKLNPEMGRMMNMA